MQTTDNSLTIGKLTTPIEIVKVFDKDYCKIFECFADCEETISLNNLDAGTYNLVVNFYDENWRDICELTEAIHVGSDESASGRSTPLALADFTLSPNPATETVNLQLKDWGNEVVHLQLVNQLGKVVQLQTVDASVGSITLNLSDVQNGLYFVQMQSNGRRLVTKKLLVNRLY